MASAEKFLLSYVFSMMVVQQHVLADEAPDHFYGVRSLTPTGDSLASRDVQARGFQEKQAFSNSNINLEESSLDDSNETTVYSDLKGDDLSSMLTNKISTLTWMFIIKDIENALRNELSSNERQLLNSLIGGQSQDNFIGMESFYDSTVALYPGLSKMLLRHNNVALNANKEDGTLLTLKELLTLNLLKLTSLQNSEMKSSRNGLGRLRNGFLDNGNYYHY